MREDLKDIWDCLCDQMDDCANCPFQDFDCSTHVTDLSIEEIINRLSYMAAYIRNNC